MANMRVELCRPGWPRLRRGLASHFWALLVLAALFATGDLPAQDFRRGEVDGKNGLSITDAVQLLHHLFAGGQLASGCQDAADADDNGKLEVTDAVFILHYLFLRGPAPQSPFPNCTTDPTEDTLTCESFPACDLCAGRGDGFFYVIDRSGSFAAEGGLAVAKREVQRIIAEFSCFVEFGVVFFDSSITRFPASGDPARATDSNKEAARDFIASITGGSGTCLKDGLFAGLDFADRSTAPRKVLVYLGDGGATCQGADEGAYRTETLAAVRDRNQGRVKINVLGVGSLVAGGEDFLRTLAAENGGTYTRINP
jgi:hypothetical protein